MDSTSNSASAFSNKPNALGIAVVTGASIGIGAVYADRLARRGYDLLLVARDRQRLDELAEQLRHDTGVTVEIIAADLTQPADLARIESRLRADERISMLVNNAGMAVAGTFASADIDRVESMILLNVLVVTRLASAVVPGMTSRGHGTIVNISSVLALAPEQFTGTYSGTKAYVLNLSQSMQRELDGSGVHVQVVLPGATRTEIWDRAGTGIANLPPEILMDAGEMVDAALLGLDRGETVTIPALEAIEQWESLTAARLALGPQLSRNRPATRYRQLAEQPA